MMFMIRSSIHMC